MGREYISKDPKFGYWRDTHLKVWGDAVMALQMRFALDWNFATRKNLFTDSRYFTYNGERKGCRRMQIIASGPDEMCIRDRFTATVTVTKFQFDIFLPNPLTSCSKYGIVSERMEANRSFFFDLIYK